MGTILVVDDDVELGNRICKLLEQRGHAVSQVQDGRAALAFVRSHPVDLLLLDVLMPEMDGFETALQVRQIASPPRVVLMSGGSDRFDRQYLMTVGGLMPVAGVLEKPFSLESLFGTVEGALLGQRVALRS